MEIKKKMGGNNSWTKKILPAISFWSRFNCPVEPIEIKWKARIIGLMLASLGEAKYY